MGVEKMKWMTTETVRTANPSTTRNTRRKKKRERKEQERRRQEEELKRLKRERMRQLEERLAPFGPRPHWGKLFTMDPRASYDRLPGFTGLMDRFDPAGKFRNDFLAGVLTLSYGRSKVSTAALDGPPEVSYGG